MLDGNCTFNVLVYADADSEVPLEWGDSDAKEITNGEKVQLRNFSTSNHRVDTLVSYRYGAPSPQLTPAYPKQARRLIGRCSTFCPSANDTRVWDLSLSRRLSCYKINLGDLIFTRRHHLCLAYHGARKLFYLH